MIEITVKELNDNFDEIYNAVVTEHKRFKVISDNGNLVLLNRKDYDDMLSQK